MIFDGYQEIVTNPSAVPQYRMFHAALRESVTPLVFDCSRLEYVRRVHAHVNEKIAYHPEPGGRDEWRMNPTAGDCEDFAITKYAMIEQFFGPDPMRVIIGRLFGVAAHAILAVWVDGEWLISDNRYKTLRRASQIEGFVPLFGLNRNGQWLHIHARSVRR